MVVIYYMILMSFSFITNLPTKKIIMSYKDKASELINGGLSIKNICIKLYDLCVEADEQIATSIPKKLVEALSDDINSGNSERVNRFYVIQKIKLLLSNQSKGGE